MWRLIAKAAVLKASGAERFVALTSGSAPAPEPLSSVTGEGKPITAVVDMSEDSAVRHLLALCDAK